MNQGKSRYVKYNLYYWGLIVYLIANNIAASYAYNIWAANGSNAVMIVKAMRYIAYVLFVLKICSKTIVKLRSIYLVLLCIGVSVLAMLGSDRSPLFYLLIVIASIQADFKKTVNIFLRIQLVFFILYTLLGILGISGSDYVVTQMRERYFLGYGWVNRAAYCWLFICLEYLYLHKGKIKPKEIIVSQLINAFIYYKTKTLFPMLLTAGIGGYGFYNYIKSGFSVKTRIHSKKALACAILMFSGFFIIGIVLPLRYSPDNAILRSMNLLLNSRLSLAKTVIDKYGFGLLGHDVQWTGASTLMFGLSSTNEYFYADCDYVKLGIQYGMLFCGFVVVSYLAGIVKAYYYREPIATFCILFIGLLCIFEPELIDFTFNPFFLYSFTHISLYTTRKNYGFWKALEGMQE